jgi:hypothetical protein
MSTWYYYNEQGERISVNGGQLKGLAKAGLITPETMVETEDGKTAPAQKVKGLTFITAETIPSEMVDSESAQPVEPEIYGLAASPPKSSPFADFALEIADTSVADSPKMESPFSATSPITGTPFVAASSPFTQTTPAQTAPPAGSCFCTNCGKPISEQAVACMSCGAPPVGHRRFCRNCGAALNPEQVICTKCGAAISSTGVSRPAVSGAVAGQKSGASTAALILGILGMIFALLIPLLGMPITIAGFICGLCGIFRDGRGRAKVGLVLSIIGLALAILNIVIGILFFIYLATQ